ncbi:hypothetical protein NMG60_11013157 [Bertholletia excelsa]
MGSGSSRLGSRPSRSGRRRRKRSFSSLFICGGSTSSGIAEMEDEPSESLVNSTKHNEPIADELQSLTKESWLTSGSRTELTRPRTEDSASSESSRIANENNSSDSGLSYVDTSMCLCKDKEFIPSNEFTTDYRGNHEGSTSYRDQSSSYGVDDVMEKDASQIGTELTCPSSSSSQELGDSNSDEVSVEHNDYVSTSIVSDSHSTSHGDDNFQESTHPSVGFLVSDREQGRRDRSVLQVDVVSISSSNFSGSSSEISSREARRNSRRLFWDALSRRSSRRHSDSHTFVFSTDDSDGLGSRNRWLLDFSENFFDHGVEGESSSGYMGNRNQSMIERHWRSRSEFWERLHGGRERGNTRTGTCPIGLHPSGTCSCDSVLMAEESGTRASISRIVMLAEALFEVLDEIHRQPLSLSLSMVSQPASEAVVDSFPIRSHGKLEASEIGDNAAECYICLSEYEEGDKIRVLPCHHEFHMSCVDKWLKEIHGVCPLCRGDVREGFKEESISNSGTPV